jgi:hypothetical protein
MEGPHQCRVVVFTHIDPLHVAVPTLALAHRI